MPVMPIKIAIRQCRLILIISIFLFCCNEQIRADAEEPLKVEEELIPAIPKTKRVFPSPALYWISEPVSVRVLIGRPLIVNCQAGVGGSGVGQKAVHLRTNWYRINNASGSSSSMTPIIDTPSDSNTNQGPSSPQKAELKMFANGTLFSRSAHKGLQGRYACVIRSQFQALTSKISITVTGSRPGFHKSESIRESDAPLIKESPRLIPAPSARKMKSSEMKMTSSEENVDPPPGSSCNAEKEEVGKILRATLESKLTKRIREAIQRSRSELLDAGSCESAEARHYPSDDEADLFQLSAEERGSLASIERKAQRGSHVQCTAALKELVRFLEDVLKKRRDKRPLHTTTTRKPPNKTTKRPNTRTTTTTTQSPNECLDCFGILDRLEMDLMANILRKGIEEAVQSILDQWDDGDCNPTGSGEDGGKSKGKKKTKKPVKTGKKPPKNGGGGKKKGKN